MNRWNRSISSLLGFVLVLAIVISPVMSAIAGERPHFSSGTGQFISATDFVGVGNATHLGNYIESGSVTLIPTSEPTVFQVVGTTDYTASNGHVLHAEVSGELNGATGAVNATLTYDGGTGRFENATGSATLIGQLFPDGSLTAVVSGTVNF